MRKFAPIVMVVCLALLVSACNPLKRMTGQMDDSVLPGQREEILPPEAQTAKDPGVNGKKPTACDPKNPDCIQPIDQESSTPQ